MLGRLACSDTSPLKRGFRWEAALSLVLTGRLWQQRRLDWGAQHRLARRRRAELLKFMRAMQVELADLQQNREAIEVVLGVRCGLSSEP